MSGPRQFTCRCGRKVWTAGGGRPQPGPRPGRAGEWWRLRNHRVPPTVDMAVPWCPTMWLPVERRKFLVVRALPAIGLALGIKRIETRSAPPGGPHSPTPGAGLPGLPLDPGEDLVIVTKRQRPTRKALALWASLANTDERAAVDDWPLGHAVAVVRYIGVCPVDDVEVGSVVDFTLGHVWRADEEPVSHGARLYRVNETEYALGEWGEGRWGWLTDTPRKLPVPVPVAGQQGIQYMTEAETDAVQEQLDALPF